MSLINKNIIDVDNLKAFNVKDEITSPSKATIRRDLMSMADALGFDVNNNVEKIAHIKSKMEDWTDCPCDHFNPHRYCGSKLCRSSVITDGHCHCNLYLRRKDETK